MQGGYAVGELLNTATLQKIKTSKKALYLYKLAKTRSAILAKWERRKINQRLCSLHPNSKLLRKKAEQRDKNPLAPAEAMLSRYIQGILN